MEADFNFHNRLIFGSHILDTARANCLIPAEQYSEKQSTVDDGSFDKILQGGISRQRRLPMPIISANAANCYDGVHHALMALLFLYIGPGGIYRCYVELNSVSEILPSYRIGQVQLIHWWGHSQDSPWLLSGQRCCSSCVASIKLAPCYCLQVTWLWYKDVISDNESYTSYHWCFICWWHIPVHSQWLCEE